MTDCPRCGLPIAPGQAVDQDHVIPTALGGTRTQPAHRRCNRSHGAHLGLALRHNRRLTTAHQLLADPEPGRLVVLITGPPAAGKTTTARLSQLRVYDRDDPRWAGPRAETRFRAALAQLGRTPRARAVIIRSGPTARGRADTITTARATHSYRLAVPPETSHQRITELAPPDAPAQHRAIAHWWERHKQDPYSDAQPDWPGGWDKVLGWAAMTGEGSSWPG